VNKASNLSKYGLVAILNADYLFSRQDFRSDERALQALSAVASECTCPLVIQGADLPARLEGLTADRLLEERRRFGYPPFTRLVEIKVSDKNEARRAKMSALLAREFGSLQIFLPKDASLAAAKADIARRLAAFERQYKYRGHIYADVDPL
jgi:primosomal protein N' (replication factor Y)